MLRAGPGYQNVITTDLVDDPLLTAENLRTFKSTFKELYDFSIRFFHGNTWVMFRLCILMSCFDSVSAFCAACDHEVLEKIREAQRGCE
jgi:hypothetical protein